ncbi:MAG: fatty acid desaturase [Chroococcidiopsidaceae cyanobacterium CP_BM_ER_R8_30]|nr:fatty acid desaturase [Chroococcidiopsidaceae cyanobacterium CP_BM_ER_R8_30]
MFKEFKTDPFFMLRYYIINFIILLPVDLFLYFKSPFSLPTLGFFLFGLLLLIMPNFRYIACSEIFFITAALYFFQPDFSFWNLALIPLGVIVGLYSAAMIHNAAHTNIKPQWLSRLIGEICGLHQLGGFVGWVITHYLHHCFPDDLEKDPHPPHNLQFWKFADEMKNTIRGALTRSYFETWGEAEKYQRIWTRLEILLLINRFLRALLWLLIFGPISFTFFFVPSYISNVLIFYHFNYYTHRQTQEEVGEIMNLNHNIYYKLMNTLLFGTYFHKNHHLNPNLFDPRKLKMTSKAESLLSQA